MDQAAFLEMLGKSPYWAELVRMKDSVLSLASQLSPMNLMILGSLVMMIWQRYDANKQAQINAKKKFNKLLDASDYPPIEPLENFQWEKTEPIKFRPFKPKYHLTMALETLNPNDLIPIDKTYKERLTYRRKLLKQYPDIVIGVNNGGNKDPRIRRAVEELYTYVMGIYLPNRYPTMFKLVQSDFETGKFLMVQNLVTDEVFPTQLNPTRPLESTLQTLIKTVDEDMLILLPELDHDGKPTSADEPKYILEAYAACYPAGFDTRKKLGKRLSEIHGPVPGYKQKLEKSMDRFFHKLEVGKYVKRVNWSITTGEELFAAFGGLHGEQQEEMRELRVEELDLDNTFLRCERQTLYRLPHSGALVFGFHTYRYTLQEVKDDGSGEDLVAAIDGFKEGTSPQMLDYKRVPEWGQAVKDFMRG
ncbi:hypothetical protein FQN55_004443 [Onygenales sp. PD_40]|nr:hypothetical protein FQN55_004443 [Onygenales sp. PD_40]KAK2784426.1 hypothetical protein FQN52_009007 [Onygenales sp. PD_12]KAK2786247.1 hypothetical protein FQN53_006801 [Emmonsiellopsis sp. PD_33]KAK2786840.1 hypothetical protein FQN51_003485 [Onygenales sp. PD_10]